MKHVYDMSFAEFQIRLFAWKRVQTREWEKVRILAWHVRASSINAPKKMPSLEKFMKLDTDREHNTGVTPEQKARFMEAYADYINQVNNK